MRVKMSKQTPPAPTAGAVGPCPTVIKIVGRPGTGPSHHPTTPTIIRVTYENRKLDKNKCLMLD